MKTTLIATWNDLPGNHSELPTKMSWVNGKSASMDDYLRHKHDAQYWTEGTERSIELCMFPGIIADVEHDPIAGAWAVSGYGVTPIHLQITDPGAGDDAITAALHSLPVVYRHNIHRE